MIIYNETFVVETGSATAWFNWMKVVYVPQVVATGHFNSFKILKVLDSPNEGVTYCFQFITDDLQKYHLFSVDNAPFLHAKVNEAFQNKFVIFNTIMQLLD